MAENLFANKGTFTNLTQVLTDRPLRPTVYIGLGGTGLKVLARFRQRIHDRYGNPDHWPQFGFLGIDSDNREIDTGGVVKGKGIAIGKGDLFHIGMTPGEVSKVLDGLHKVGAYGHFDAWISPECINYSQFGFSEGAGQIRAAGRMLFAYHMTSNDRQDVPSKLLSRCQSVRGIEAIRQALLLGARFNVHGGDDVGAPPTDIVIIAGIGGGTGAGSFMDCAFLARYLAITNPADIGEIRGMLVLPDILDSEKSIGANQRKIIDANAYAALRELEYYCESGRTSPRSFPISAWGISTDVAEIRARPFDVCYLFSKDNGTPLSTADDMYDMLADALAFSSGGTTMAGKMRSAWSNAQNSVYGGSLSYNQPADYDHGAPEGTNVANKQTARNFSMFERTWSTRFSSLGIASVTMKLPELRRLAAIRVLRRLVELELGKEPNRLDPAYVSEVHGAAAKIEEMKDFVLKPVRDYFEVARNKVIESESGKAARDKAEALLRELREISQGVEFPGSSTRKVVRELHVQATHVAKKVVEDICAPLANGEHRRTQAVLEDLVQHHAQRPLEVPPLGNHDVNEIPGVKQWVDLDGARDDIFGLNVKARGIIVKKFANGLRDRIDHYLNRINSSLKQHYLNATGAIFKERGKAVTSDIQDLNVWAVDLRVAQNSVATNFQDKRNEVLTKNLAISADDTDRQPQLDAEIDRALKKSVGGTDAELLKTTRSKALEELARVRGLGAEVRPTTLLGTKRQGAKIHADTLDQLVDYIARGLLLNLPEKQDIFDVLVEPQEHTVDVVESMLPSVAARAHAYWKMAEGHDYEGTIEKVSLAAAVIPPPPPPHIQKQIEEYFKHIGADFAPAAVTDQGAPLGEIVIVNEIHGFALPSFARLASLKQAYDDIVAEGKGNDRHLDKRLKFSLPDLRPVVSAQADDEVRSWDTVLLGIMIGGDYGGFDWVEEQSQFQFRPDPNRRLPVGNSYEAVAAWLRMGENSEYRAKMDAAIERYFEQKIEAIFDPDCGSDAALNAAKSIELLDLMLELMGEYTFPRIPRGPNSFSHPPDHTMVIRLRRKLQKNYLDTLCHGGRWGKIDQDELYKEMALQLHLYVQFVGPPLPVGARDLEMDAARKRKLLQRCRKRDPKDRSVLEEAFKIGWFRKTNIRNPRELQTLFPSQDLSSGGGKRGYDDEDFGNRATATPPSAAPPFPNHPSNGSDGNHNAHPEQPTAASGRVVPDESSLSNDL